MRRADQAIDLVRRGARIRVHSGAVGCGDVVLAEGKVIAWCAAPSLTIEHDDGTRSSWSCDLPITEVEQDRPKAVPYEPHINDDGHVVLLTVRDTDGLEWTVGAVLAESALRPGGQRRPTDLVFTEGSHVTAVRRVGEHDA